MVQKVTAEITEIIEQPSDRESRIASSTIKDHSLTRRDYKGQPLEDWTHPQGL